MKNTELSFLKKRMNKGVNTMNNIAKAIMQAEGSLNFFELTILALEEIREEERLKKEAENGKQLKKASTKSGKTRHSDFSFSTEHESKQTA